MDILLEPQHIRRHQFIVQLRQLILLILPDTVPIPLDTLLEAPSIRRCLQFIVHRAQLIHRPLTRMTTAPLDFLLMLVVLPRRTVQFNRGGLNIFLFDHGNFLGI